MKNLKLDINYIELFALAYSVAEAFFKVDPIQASARKQRKIRKWVYKNYVEDEELPQKVLRYLDTLKDDRAFIAFLKDCADYIEENGTWKQQLYERAAVDFSEPVRKAFEYLFFETGYCEYFETKENQILLTVDDNDSHKRTLILHNPDECTLSSYEYLEFSEGQLLKLETGYKLVCAGYDSEQDRTILITFFFEYATCEIQLFKADDDGREKPWEKLEIIANCILGKSHLGEEYLNQQEKELLPLLKEIGALSIWAPIPEEEVDFHVLKQYIKKHQLNRLLPKLEKLATKISNKEKPMVYWNQINAKLNDSRCEALWRELYALITASQKCYEEKTISNSAELQNIRMQIEQRFHEQGYTGSYPTFRKKGAMKKIHLEQSYGQLYFVGAKKEVEYMIHCVEYESGNVRNIEFMCGTALLKKNEKVDDIYSFCFDYKGRRLIKSIFWDMDDVKSLDDFTTIAVKRAECIRLNKEEMNAIGKETLSWANFLGIVLVCGGLFTILMLLATFIILCLVDMILFGASDIPNLIAEMPWGVFAGICFFGFGVTMAIFERIAQYKC